MKLYITFNFECDNCVNIYNQIKQKYNYLITNYIEESTHIIAIGGDGYLLVCLNKFISYNKKIYGINGGTKGKILNKFSLNTLIDDINNSDIVTVSPLQVNIGNDIKYAFNEVSIIRKSPQTTHLNINIDKNNIKLIGDGVIISTALGSSGYNYSAGSPILPIKSNLISLMPICCNDPKHWKGSIIDNFTEISVSVIKNIKRPVTLNIDNLNYESIENIKINYSKIKINLLYKNFNKFNFDRHFNNF